MISIQQYKQKNLFFIGFIKHLDRIKLHSRKFLDPFFNRSFPQQPAQQPTLKKVKLEHAVSNTDDLPDWASGLDTDRETLVDVDLHLRAVVVVVG